MLFRVGKNVSAYVLSRNYKLQLSKIQVIYTSKDSQEPNELFAINLCPNCQSVRLQLRVKK